MTIPTSCRGDDARLVAEQTRAFEEFIAGGPHPNALSFRTDKAKILVHGHCHQKSLVGLGPSHKALGLLTQAQIDEIPSGCCGMAGSFGYESEHYALSLQIGELTLFPTVREASEEATIAAAGISCRHKLPTPPAGQRGILHRSSVRRCCLHTNARWTELEMRKRVHKGLTHSSAWA
jgi:Fe-S oxidoreductase